MILNGVPRSETPVNYVPTLGGKSALFKRAEFKPGPPEGVNTFLGSIFFS